MKRAGSSTAALKVNAVTGPTPGAVIRRRQTSSWRAARLTLRVLVDQLAGAGRSVGAALTPDPPPLRPAQRRRSSLSVIYTPASRHERRAVAPFQRHATPRHATAARTSIGAGRRRTDYRFHSTLSIPSSLVISLPPTLASRYAQQHAPRHPADRTWRRSLHSRTVAVSREQTRS